MKHIRKFNELNTSTYSKVADRLHNMGHKRRAGNMREWIKEKDRKESISYLKDYGPFKMDYMGKDGKLVLTGSFYIAIDFLPREVVDYYFDSIDEDNNLKYEAFYLNFDLGLIPADKETLDKFLESKQYDKDAVYMGIYWNTSLSINIIQKGESKIDPNGNYYFDTRDNDHFFFSERREALKFKRILSQAVSGNNDYGKAKNNEPLHDKLKKLFSNPWLSRDIFNEESFKLFVDTVKRLSINKLYIN